MEIEEMAKRVVEEVDGVYSAKQGTFVRNIPEEIR